MRGGLPSARMRDGVTIIDADRHVLEPFEMWDRYLPATYRGQLELRHDPRTGFPTPCLDGESIWRPIPPSAEAALASGARSRRAELDAAHTADGQFAAMDAVGIDAAVLFPTFASYLVGIDGLEADRALAFARAYNLWLKDLRNHDRKRLLGAWLVAPHDPAALPGEVEAALAHGCVAIAMRPNPIGGRTLGDPAYEPFYSACAEYGLPIILHEGTHARAPTAGADRFHSRFALHACSHPMEQMMAFLALVEGGVFVRHPELKVGFWEAGCGWVPYWLGRLDHIAHPHHGEEVAARALPSHLFAQNAWVGFEPDEPDLPVVATRVGRRKLCFGTDFPHLDHESDLVGSALALRSELGDDLDAMLSGNARELFGLQI